MKNVINTFFFPPFLRRLDEKLLLERPSLWATRLHRVAWPAFLLCLLAIVGGLLAPIHHPAELASFVSRGAWLIVPLQIGLLIYWLYRQDAYHESREFGLHGRKSVWQEFGASVAALVMVNLALFLFITAAQQRIRTLPKQTIARDMFVLHTLDNLWERNKWSCKHNKFNSRADCMALAADNLIESNFKTSVIHSYLSSERRKFIQTHVSPDDIFALRDQWQNEDYELTMAIIAQYSGEPLDDVVSDWNSRFTHRKQMGEARSNLLYDLFDLGYNSEWIGWFWLLIGTAAIHIALLRFTFKYAGGKWFLITIGSLFGLYVLTIFFGIFGYIFYELIDAFFNVFDNLFDKIDWSSNPRLNIGLFLLPPLIIALFFTTRLHRQSRFTTKSAIALYLLPLLLIGGCYLLIGIGEELTEAVHGRLPRVYRRDHILWELSPREILTYLAQFGYIPFLGWLKRKHTQLIALPRH